MGVYIKGMDMPKSCQLCDFKMWDSMLGREVCKFTSREPASVYVRADCPLIPVPPHGDLIDRSKIEYTYAMQGGVLMTSNKIIDRLPSIIPQE